MFKLHPTVQCNFKNGSHLGVKIIPVMCFTFFFNNTAGGDQTLQQFGLYGFCCGQSCQ